MLIYIPFLHFPMKKEILVGLTALLMNCNSTPKYETTAAKVQLAQCLVDKGAVMYGTEWCPACYTQKEKIFGPEAWNVFKTNYVDCEGSEENYRLCTDKKIKTIPAFEFKGDKIVTGYKSLEQLAKLSRCD